MASKDPLPKILEIIWVDCYSDPDDFKVEEIIKDSKYRCERRCVGYYVAENEDYIFLAEDKTTGEFLGKGEAQWAGLIAVPKGMVKKKKIIRT